ncbi:hypothetical protein DL240_10250 [Lujinxingia litoralis]|uniref:Uncharacterized protein n=2 Tax=Lujinxingia litoralis TaxID=2211119 RepID=A0A328C8H5_9DELT|nr:hypothetical protein DL240_10250 [Lujinxingia litoralis]
MYRVWKLPLLLVLLLTWGCGDAGTSPPGAGDDGGTTLEPPGDGDQDPSGPEAPEPEVPETFEFSSPAIVGDQVYVANRTLDAVAIIDSQSLAVRAVPVGREPSQVVAPPDDGGAGARVMVLNQGDSTLSLLDPQGGPSLHLPIVPNANRLAISASGRYGVAWYDSEEDGPIGDLSALSVVSTRGSFDVAVGFRVREVLFDGPGERAVVVSDDGVSVLELEAIDADRFVAPRLLTPDEFAQVEPEELRLHLAPDGDTLVAWSPLHPFLFVSELEADRRYAIYLGAVPTGAALSADRLVVALPEVDQLVVLSLPDGPDEVRLAQEALGLWGEEGFVPPLPEDAAEPDLGLESLLLPVGGLGSVVLSEDASAGLVFTTRPEVRDAVVVDFLAEELREVRFEKEVIGVFPDVDGSTFLVVHPRRPGSRQGLTPSDPEFIERSHGFSVLAMASAQTRLVLTELAIARAVLFAPSIGPSSVYLSFEPPAPGEAERAAHREVVRVNLTSFSNDVFSLASLPQGMGLIPQTGRIYIDQSHPRGRITFVMASTGERETVTGFQLNAGIE